MSRGNSLLHQILRAHQWLYEHTDGRIGHRMLGVTSLLLSSTGRRSGRLRRSALFYARDPLGYVVVASDGGADRPPGWFFNLQSCPGVAVQIGRRKLPATARIIESGDSEYDRLWRLANDNTHQRFDRYQKRTPRPIPIVILAPS